MSIARVNRVTAARKDQGTCGKCGVALPAGAPYLWFTVGFRSKAKRRRCLEAACFPKDSERESSRLSEVYAAREDAEERIADADNAEDLREIVEEYAQAVRDLGEEYREACEDENGNVFNTTAEERADALESAADEIESAADSIDDATTDCEACEGTGEIDCEPCDGEGCEECSSTGEIDCEACEGTGQVPDVDGMREAAQEALNTDLGC